MKKINTWYWVITSIFGAFMLSSAVGDILILPDAVKMVSNDLGYPEYIIPFLGWAKALGVVAILVPGFPRIREWAYAGLFFDLLGATYSGISTSGFQLPMLTMILPFSFLFISHALHHKRLKAQTTA